MKIIDITQEVFSCAVYPGDEAPRLTGIKRTARGDLYNLTSFAMSAHNGTHVDAPFHFLADGDTVEQIPLEKTVGPCYVAQRTGEIDRVAAQAILDAARRAENGCEKRILLKGRCIVTEEAACVFAGAGVLLVGVEGQSVGPERAPMAVHKILLAAKTVLLEGLRPIEAKEGAYMLCAAPLKLGGCDGAPCRALLMEC